MSARLAPRRRAPRMPWPVALAIAMAAALLFAALAALMETDIHALSIDARTPDQG